MSKQKYISRESFKQALENKNSEVRNQMDAFEEEALKGWEQSQIPFSAIQKLDNRMGRAKFSGKLLYASMGVLILIILSLGILFWNKSDKAQDKPEPKLVQVTYDKTDIVLPESIDSLIDIPIEEQITTKEIIKTQQEIERKKIETPDLEEQINIPYPELTLAPLPPRIEQQPKSISQQRVAKEIYLKSLKAIDYSAYRSKPVVPVEQIILTGVPADQENKQTNETVSPEFKTVEIPYMDYLEKTLGYVNKEKWKIALSRFQEILKNYPEDVNAHFYAGWCNYNLGQYEAACTNFSACLQLDFSNFNEEAEWYLAQSRLAKGEKQLAKEMLTKIKNQGEFYAKQAEKILKTWK